jgi:hypothetical protein
MRDLERRIIEQDALVAVGQDVDVDGARPPPLRAIPPQA